jgi:flagellar biosynthesis protein FliQ
VIKVIQASTKTFEHSLAFPPRALQILANNGITSCAGLAILLLN